MRQCIYCGKIEPDVSFESREHVVPELLGTFTNNLTLHGQVCDTCNRTLFSPLETSFKEDTEEGIYFQMLNLSGSVEVRVRNQNYRFALDLGVEETFFNTIFPFRAVVDGHLQVIIEPQIRIDGYCASGFRVLRIADVESLPRTQRRFKRLVESLRGVTSSQVSIFVYSDSSSDDSPEHLAAVDLIRELGIPYTPTGSKFLPPPPKHREVDSAVIKMEYDIGSDTGRVLAKIAFNYFAYCAVRSGCEALLNHQNFSRVKSYILGQVDLPIREVILKKPTYQPLLMVEKESEGRFIVHVITLRRSEDGQVIAELTFMGRLVYTVMLGATPAALDRSDFGNGHLFNPISHEILGLTRSQEREGSQEKLDFSLFSGHYPMLDGRKAHSRIT